jgi:hypothetical protein
MSITIFMFSPNQPTKQITQERTNDQSQGEQQKHAMQCKNEQTHKQNK